MQSESHQLHSCLWLTQSDRHYEAVCSRGGRSCLLEQVKGTGLENTHQSLTL